MLIDNFSFLSNHFYLGFIYLLILREREKPTKYITVIGLHTFSSVLELKDCFVFHCVLLIEAKHYLPLNDSLRTVKINPVIRMKVELN